MLIGALILNIVILVPVLASLAMDAPGMADAFGSDTVARRILACVYGAIAALSTALLALHMIGHGWAVPMTLALFAMQIAYKSATVVVVGPENPVVATNICVIAVQVAAIAFTLRAGSFPA